MKAGITRKIRDDQAKFLAFLCTSDRETMLYIYNIYNEGRWQAWGDANISFMQKTQISEKDALTLDIEYLNKTKKHT